MIFAIIADEQMLVNCERQLEMLRSQPTTLQVRQRIALWEHLRDQAATRMAEGRIKPRGNA